MNRSKKTKSDHVLPENGKRLIYELVFTVLFLAVIVIVLMFRIHDRDNTIRELGREADELKLKLELISPEIQYSDDSYNVLCIGNSITTNRKCAYWFNEIGMAASVPEKDYVHILSEMLHQKYGEVSCYPLEFYVWEIQNTNRCECFAILDPYLDPKLDLIVIQIGENVTDLTSYEEDYKALIEYIRSYAPNAELVIVDDFWTAEDKGIIEKKVASDEGCLFADLGEIKDDDEYCCGYGTIVYDDLGGEHVVDHPGVAAHPGDKGMEFIAKKIFDLL